jgi:hypothetical protein
MSTLTEEGRQIVALQSARHHVSPETVMQLLEALRRGGGTQAQFSIAELGGMGQWAPGGMVMIGDMFNSGLKARVDALCTDLAAALREGALFTTTPQNRQQGADWPHELGHPASQGAQNDLRYAYFPDRSRLAVAQGGRVTVYDTADHRISGFGQAQGGGQSLSFTSQHGNVPLESLRVVSGGGEKAEVARPAAEDTPKPPASAETAATDDQIFTRIERLADLHARGILSAEEFAAKKAELLARL